MKSAADRLREIKDTVEAYCGHESRQALERVLAFRQQHSLDRLFNLLDETGLSTAVSLDLGRQATKAGRDHRRLVRAALFVRALQRGMDAVEINLRKTKYRLKSDAELIAILRKSFNEDTIWSAGQLGGYQYRETYVDQRNITLDLDKFQEGICTGLAILWIYHILNNPGESAFQRTHDIKKLREKAINLQGIRETIKGEYDGKFGAERQRQVKDLESKFDVDEINEIEKRLSEIERRIRHLDRYEREMSLSARQKEIGTLKTEQRERRRRLEKLEEPLMKARGELRIELDKQATEAQIVELISQAQLKLVAQTVRVPLTETSLPLVAAMDKHLQRPAAFLMSVSFFVFTNEVRHMMCGYWTNQSTRIFDPNSGEFSLPSGEPGELIDSLGAHYSIRGASISDAQAFQVSAPHQI